MGDPKVKRSECIDIVVKAYRDNLELPKLPKFPEHVQLKLSKQYDELMILFDKFLTSEHDIEGNSVIIKKCPNKLMGIAKMHKKVKQNPHDGYYLCYNNTNENSIIISLKVPKDKVSNEIMTDVVLGPNASPGHRLWLSNIMFKCEPDKSLDYESEISSVRTIKIMLTISDEEIKERLLTSIKKYKNKGLFDDLNEFNDSMKTLCDDLM